MSQYLSQVMTQQLRQEQRLTPQLIQSMNILQLNVASLDQRIQEELETNPILEYEPDNGQDLQAGAEPEEPASPDGQGLEVLEWLSEQYGFNSGERAGVSRSSLGERDTKMDAMANTACRPINLYEHLMKQWALVEVEDEVRRSGEAIISHLEDDGFLRVPLEVVADSVRPSPDMDTLQGALERVQQLEPVGVGARDLCGCLLLQLGALPGDNSLEERLIANHLEDVVKNRLPRVAKVLGCEIEEIKEAIRVISRLTPSPGLSVADREVPRITPDVIVDYADDGSGYTVRLARGNEPRLRISRKYLEMLKDRKQDKAARVYLKQHHESASALIDAILFRRDRLLEVAEAVVERQTDFFDQGPQAMKVLRMSELADQFDCDPSTISRTVADKYIQSPRGIHPLRDFFVGGTERRNGESTSWDSVKARVQELINEEDKLQPLSDEQVAKSLSTEGIKLSRRTVAKYRQQLNIAPARQRKVY